MSQDTAAHPPVATREEWLRARKELLESEKELTRQRDTVNAARRRLPMVRLERDYEFEGPEGRVSLLDVFQGRRQLIVYHFMFDPAWDKGCSGCTGLVDAMGDLSMLPERDTTIVLVSRAPLAKLQAYREQRGWDLPWYSSADSLFNYDFHATADSAVAPPEYNYRSQAELTAGGSTSKLSGEQHGLSVFFRLGDDVYHTYSTYARGCESLTDAYNLLDVTPYGRQEDFEDSPPGWPQRTTYG